jgi:hypothetical protein
VNALAGIAIAAALVVSGCTKDVVLPDQVVVDTCGDGIKGPTEECDNDGPGCSNCAPTPGYACDDQNHCFVPCGDGIEGDGDDCTNAHKPEACDMTGYWVARETDFTRDQVIDAVQTASTWFVYHFAQHGSSFEIAEDIHCGIKVTGSATVEYTKGTERAFLYANDMTKAGPHGPRKGTFEPAGDGCRFELDRWYNIRGGVLSLLPGDFLGKPPLADLPALPSVPNPVHPPNLPIPGATDPDHDGHPGASYLVTGIVNGIRNSVQRDYKEFASNDGQWVPRHAIDFVVPGGNDLQEDIFSVTKCGSGCELIASHGFVDPKLIPRVHLHFLGKTLDGSNIATVIAGKLRSDPSVDEITCENARAVLPHDPSPD